MAHRHILPSPTTRLPLENPPKLTFVLCRDHPAEEVYVTGTFDNWQKSEKLVKNGDVFSKDVTLKSADEKIYYKVRGNDNR